MSISKVLENIIKLQALKQTLHSHGDFTVYY